MCRRRMMFVLDKWVMETSAEQSKTKWLKTRPPSTMMTERKPDAISNRAVL